MKELDALRKLAEAADLNIDWIGAGPTRHGDLISTSGKPLFIDSVYLDCDEQDVDGDDYFVCSVGSDEYGRFIAAASPRTVIRLLDDLKAAEQQRDELIAQKFSEEPLRRQIAELRELGRFREKHFLTGSPEVYDDPSAAFHKFACEMHDALKVGGGETAHNAVVQADSRGLMRERAEAIEAAAKNLIAQKGRHNTEVAYKRLVEAVNAPVF